MAAGRAAASPGGGARQRPGPAQPGSAQPGPARWHRGTWGRHGAAPARCVCGGAGRAGGRRRAHPGRAPGPGLPPGAASASARARRQRARPGGVGRTGLPREARPRRLGGERGAGSPRCCCGNGSCASGVPQHRGRMLPGVSGHRAPRKRSSWSCLHGYQWCLFQASMSKHPFLML